MTPEQFAYWLQGFVELNGDNQPTPEQWKSISEHLQTMFKKVTPPVSSPAPSDLRRVSTQGPAFADPARHMSPLELLERGIQIGRPMITC